MMVEYGSSEDGEEREKFWNGLDKIVDQVGNWYRLCLLGYLNGWIGDRVRVSITVAFGVPREKDNGRSVEVYC